MKRIWKYKHILFLIILGLVPLLWFVRHPGVLITGSDTNFPLNPDIWFHRRFFVWQTMANAGSDFSSSTAGVFFHFLQFLPYKLGVSLVGVDILNLVFWFSLIIFSSFVLARLIFPKKNMPRLVFVVLYSFNIYLFNTFENVKVANLALVACIPLGISLLIMMREGRIGRGVAAILSVIVGVILSGAGINPAYIVCFFLILFIFLLSEVFNDFGQWKLIRSRIFDFLTIGFFITLVNSFWILPTINFIFTNITSSNSIGALGFVNWVDSLSVNTSIVNVLRMQGAWDWYSLDSVTGIPLYIPYAMRYFYDPFFITFSFIIPSLAFLSFVFKRKKFNLYYLMFGLMLPLGIFLTAGTHDPTGPLFKFFASHVPFFSLFRSPWYIFAPLVGLSIAGLVAIFFYNLRIIGNLVAGVFIFLFLVYSYPLVLGKIFRPNLPTNFYIKFPSYVFEAENFLNKSQPRGRILSYPDDNIENFKWGYAAVDSILDSLTNREVIYASLNDISSPLSKTTTNLYESIKKSELQEAQNLASVLGIGQIFYKGDQSSLTPPLSEEVTKNEAAAFGPWKFYNFGDQLTPKIFTANSLLVSLPYSDTSLNLGVIKNVGLINPSDKLLLNSDVSGKAGVVVHAENSQAKNFTDNVLDNFDPSKVDYTFTAPKDGYYKPVMQKYLIDKSGISDGTKLNGLLDGENFGWNILGSDDSFLYFDSVYIKKGEHKVVVNLRLKNLIDVNAFSKEGKGNFDFSGGGFTVTNKSESDADFKFQVLPFDPLSLYIVTGRYSHIYGQPVKIVAEQSNKGTLYKDQPESFPNSPEMENFRFYFSPVESPTQFFVHLVATENKGDLLGTKVMYSNVAVYRVFSNDLFFEEDQVNKFDTPSVIFNEDSPVSYSGKVKNVVGPHIIIFNENYSNQWGFNIDGKGDARAFHFMANGYENAWYVDSVSGDYKFSIYYKPQSLLKIGYGISILSIVVAGGFYVVLRKRNQNARKL